MLTIADKRGRRGLKPPNVADAIGGQPLGPLTIIRIYKFPPDNRFISLEFVGNTPL